jgi:hypothetical protein
VVEMLFAGRSGIARRLAICAAYRQIVRTSRKALALVESAAQLLNVVEWAYQTRSAIWELTILALAPTDDASRRQLSTITKLARALGHKVRWLERRLGPAATARTAHSLAFELSGVDRLLVGVHNSRLIELLLAIGRAAEVIILDDGIATLAVARSWAAGAGLLGEQMDTCSRYRRQIATLASRRMGAGTQLTLFTFLPVRLNGAGILRNDFSWLRSYYPAPKIKLNADLIGSPLAETGVLERDRYLRSVETLASQHSVDRYFAHHQEDPGKLAQIAQLGIRVVRPDLPLELILRRDVIGATVVSFSSNVVQTLPLALSDTATTLLICDALVAEARITRAVVAVAS